MFGQHQPKVRALYGVEHKCMLMVLFALPADIMLTFRQSFPKIGAHSTMNLLLYALLFVPFYVGVGFCKVQTFVRNGYTLVFDDKTNKFNANIKTRMVNTFFVVYPKQVNTYNRAAKKKVTFVIDPKYQGFAHTTGQVVRFDPTHFTQYPKDIDLVTHEVSD